MPTPIEVPSYATLSAMITPALFMTANGSLIISTSNRVARVVDRIRVLNEHADGLCRGTTGLDFVEDRLAHVAEELGHLEFRSDLIRKTLTILYVAFGMFMGSSLTLGIDVLLGRRFAFVPTTFSLLGVVLMMTASVHLVREAQRALRSNRLEVRFYRALQAKRRATVGCAGEGR